VSTKRYRLLKKRKTSAAGVHIFPAIAGLAIAKTSKGAHRGVGDAIKMTLFFDISS
jgi:hypothetical protein